MNDKTPNPKSTPVIPEDDSIRLNGIIGLLFLKELEAALTEWELVPDSVKQSPLGIETLSKIHVVSDQMGKAVQVLLDGLKIYPSHLTLVKLLMCVLGNNGMDVDAFIVARNMHPGKPLEWEAAFLTSISCQQRYLEKSEIWLKKALMESPDPVGLVEHIHAEHPKLAPLLINLI